MMKKTWTMIGVLLVSMTSFAADETVKSDEELDEKLGLSAKPFVVNLTVLNSRSELREAASVRTGLPSYDQETEAAQEIPAAILELREQRVAEREVAAFTLPVIASDGVDEPVIDAQPCYFNENNVLICD